MLSNMHGDSTFSGAPTSAASAALVESAASARHVGLPDPLGADLQPGPLPPDRAFGGARAALVTLSDHAWAVTLAIAGLVAVIGFRGADFPAQDYRVWIFKTHGFLIWDVNWYGGHADIGYSVLFPVVGAVLGTVPATALACVASTSLFGRLIGRSSSWACVVARLWFAVVVVGDLIIGRAPFACSLACSLAAVYFVRNRSTWPALAAATATSLFSPLGAAFLLLIAAGWLPTLGWRRAAPFLGALCGLGVAAVMGDGGRFPFPWTALSGPLVVVAIGLVMAPRHERTVRRVLALYGVACVIAFFVPNPVGGNMARLAAIVIGPVAAFVLLRANRRVALLVLAVPLLIFQLQPVVTAVASAAGDLSAKPQYYDGIVRFLAEHQKPVAKVEIPFTRDHWEATYVAEQVPLARGWDRQVDLSRNAVLYAPLTAQAYEKWLHDNAVSYVALSDAALDAGGRSEAQILRHPPTWLKPVYTDEHWRVWRVVDATPIAAGAATMSKLGHNGFTLTSSTTGATLVRLRWSAYWHVDSGSACLAQAVGGWTTVVAAAPGEIKVSAAISIGNDDTCTPAQLLDAGVTPVGSG